MTATLGSGERYDPCTGRFYVPVRGRLPRVTFQRYTHRCASGVLLLASAQYLSAVQVTVYRFTLDGAPAGWASTVGSPTVPPDWSTVCSGCHTAGVAWPDGAAARLEVVPGVGGACRPGEGEDPL